MFYSKLMPFPPPQNHIFWSANSFLANNSLSSVMDNLEGRDFLHITMAVIIKASITTPITINPISSRGLYFYT